MTVADDALSYRNISSERASRRELQRQHNRVLALACLAALVILPNCGESRSATPRHPAELVGTWVRLLPDSTWGDTLSYLADGRVVGSTGHRVPLSARWEVKDGPAGTQKFCASDESSTYCQTMRLEGPLLVLGGGPSRRTMFRRVAGSRREAAGDSSS